MKLAAAVCNSTVFTLQRKNGWKLKHRLWFNCRANLKFEPFCPFNRRIYVVRRHRRIDALALASFRCSGRSIAEPRALFQSAHASEAAVEIPTPYKLPSEH